MKDKCIECKFSKKNSINDLICNRINKKTGVPISIPNRCEIQRCGGFIMSRFFSFCGRSGRFFKPK